MRNNLVKNMNKREGIWQNRVKNVLFEVKFSSHIVNTTENNKVKIVSHYQQLFHLVSFPLDLSYGRKIKPSTRVLLLCIPAIARYFLTSKFLHHQKVAKLAKKAIEFEISQIRRKVGFFWEIFYFIQKTPFFQKRKREQIYCKIRLK